MANDGRDGRKVLILSNTADGLRGSARDNAAQAEARVLTDAIVDSLDRIDLFQHENGIVLVANGKVQTVSSAELRWIIEASFVQKCTVRKILATGAIGHEIEFRPIRPSEMAVRTMLTKEPKYGGLLGRLPPLEIEEPRQEVAPAIAPIAMDGSKEAVELARGKQVLARFANPDERRELELARGAEILARFANRQQAPAAEESIPVFIDKTVDPTSTQA
jgi:hypothetical protein